METCYTGCSCDCTGSGYTGDSCDFTGTAGYTNDSSCEIGKWRLVILVTVVS